MNLFFSLPYQQHQTKLILLKIYLANNNEVKMKRVFSFILISFFVFSFSCSSQINIPHKTEKITFQKNRFQIVGELKIPEEGTKHPLVIMVHGDGPAYRNYFSKLKDCILRAGYATLVWDKPGYGDSNGILNNKHLRAERADVLAAAVEHMKNHPEIDTDRIGVWGISQAGYVIPMALLKTDDISFMIMVGCPGENGINQTGYLIGRQLQFGGFAEKDAKEFENHFVQLFYAKSFEQYIKHAKPLYDNPIQRELGFVSALWNKQNWQPFDSKDEGFFDPITIIETVTIPSLVFFGEKDTQVDPIQGIEAYEKAFQKAGNQNYQIKLIPNANHGIILSETGSMKERSRKGYALEYLEIMEEWLRGLN
jgi:uncharacterized protein